MSCSSKGNFSDQTHGTFSVFPLYSLGKASCLLYAANGILNSDGELWRIQRKAGLRFFSNTNLKYFIDDVLPPLVEKLNDRLRAAAETDATIDLQGELLDLTTRLMGKIAYDVVSIQVWGNFS